MSREGNHKGCPYGVGVSGGWCTMGGMAIWQASLAEGGVVMRTMLTLDDDIADYLKERGRLDNKPFERVVNETLRRGMEAGDDAAEPNVEGDGDGNPEPFRVVTFSSEFAPGVDETKLNQINADLEMEELIWKVKKNDHPGR